MTTEPITFAPRSAPDSRPRAHRFCVDPADDLDRDPASSDLQPSLLDVARELLDEVSGPPRPRGVRVHRDTAPGAVGPAPGLPEPAGWVAAFGLAFGQALVGARPPGQLASWLDPVLLADLRRSTRDRRRARVTPPVSVVSVRIQHPTPTSLEATVHLRVGAASTVFGARLEACGRRWVCVALARSPSVRPASLSAPPRARDTA